MHKGEDTDYYLKKGFKVVGFEANPELAALCRNRFSKEIENGRLTVVEGAIVELPPGETEGRMVTFYRNKNTTEWGTVADNWARRNETLGTSHEVIQVPSVNFAQCLGKYGIPHYLKIDIEGMDTLCLRALLNFEQKPDYVSIESEIVVFGKLVEEFNLLAQLGYTRFKAVQQAGISYQIEPNPPKEGSYAAYKFEDGCSGLFGEDLPGEWKDYNQIIREYKGIFRPYKLFGAQGKLRRGFVGKALRKVLAKLLHRPMPGWYDTHAKHSSVV
jgi:FkbM family methyltransferase